MPDDLADVRHQVALANRMLANEGVLDAFGHVSVRHPRDPGRYLLARSRSPGLIEAADVLEFTLNSEPVEPPDTQLYAERVIHGCIYQVRPDVMAVCHHHAAPVMPFCIAGVELVPVFHVAAIMGESVPFWDQRDDFGDTNMLVVKPEEGRSLARALGRALRGADAAAWCDRHWPEPARARVPLGRHVPERRIPDARARARSAEPIDARRDQARGGLEPLRRSADANLGILERAGRDARRIRLVHDGFLAEDGSADGAPPLAGYRANPAALTFAVRLFPTALGLARSAAL